VLVVQRAALAAAQVGWNTRPGEDGRDVETDPHCASFFS